MIWIIALVVCVITAFLGYIILIKILDNEGFGVTVMGVFITSAIIFFILAISLLFADGLTDYPSLLSQYQEIQTLNAHKDEVRNAYYKEAKNGAMIGDLANMQQSSNLSEYVSDIAKKTALYNSMLVKHKLYKTDFFYKLWWKGIYIDSKILELQEIK
jgi:hypothetical protein